MLGDAARDTHQHCKSAGSRAWESSGNLHFHFTRADRWNLTPSELIFHPSPRSPKMARIHHKRCVMAITAQPAELCQSKIGAEDKFEASKPQTETCGQFEKRSGRGHRLRP
jgi:hypothetical protein